MDTRTLNGPEHDFDVSLDVGAATPAEALPFFVCHTEHLGASDPPRGDSSPCGIVVLHGGGETLDAVSRAVGPRGAILLSGDIESNPGVEAVDPLEPSEPYDPAGDLAWRVQLAREAW